jgi:hypothetical protein
LLQRERVGARKHMNEYEVETGLLSQGIGIVVKWNEHEILTMLQMCK